MYEVLKESIVIQTLLAENRFDDLSNFLAEKSYLGTKNEGQFFKNIDFANAGFNVIISITEDRWLKLILINDSEAYFDNGKIPKPERDKLWEKLLSNIDPGIHYYMFKGIRDAFENKMVQDYDGNYDSIYQSVGKYKYRVRNGSKWDDYNASNFTVQIDSTSSSSGQKYTKYRFMGPGKLEWIDIFFEFEDEEAFLKRLRANPFANVNDVEVSPEIILIPFQTDDSFNKNSINIDFFMALNNFNDRIWDHN